MYSRIVRRNVARVFDAISHGDPSAMLDSLAPQFVYRFHGEHALGGVRTTRAAMEQWWERIFRLLPGAAFRVDEVLVNGWPWRTRLALRLQVSGPLPDGGVYENVLFQFMTLRWGRVADIETLEDLQVLERALRIVAAAGRPEALAPPITDGALPATR